MLYICNKQKKGEEKNKERKEKKINCEAFGIYNVIRRVHEPRLILNLTFIYFRNICSYQPCVEYECNRQLNQT